MFDFLPTPIFLCGHFPACKLFWGPSFVEGANRLNSENSRLAGVDKSALGWLLAGGATHWTAGGLQEPEERKSGVGRRSPMVGKGGKGRSGVGWGGVGWGGVGWDGLPLCGTLGNWKM